MSQFSYCPLTWTFNARRVNVKINSIQEKASHHDRILRFEKLLIGDHSISIHQ